jgi:hypothetical protein
MAESLAHYTEELYYRGRLSIMDKHWQFGVVYRGRDIG